MAERKKGTVVQWQQLSPLLSIFRLMPEDLSPFPVYQAGQYIALRREDCRLTRRIIGPDGRPTFVPDLDEEGHPRRGPVTHSYSISSAPFETKKRGYLEFYIVLETDDGGEPGRLTESLFRIRPGADSEVGYVNRIVGDFTLAKRTAGFRNVCFVGTGTGLAPFASMVKQLSHSARLGERDAVRYTLIHANRSYAELAYHEELLRIEESKEFDFVYVASVSRPTEPDVARQETGLGRANNMLRQIFGMPLKEEEDLARLSSGGGDVSEARRALDRSVRPRLPSKVSRDQLLRRLEPSETVLLTCGNPSSMADIKAVAVAQGLKFEKEDWKVEAPARA